MRETRRVSKIGLLGLTMAGAFVILIGCAKKDEATDTAASGSSGKSGNSAVASSASPGKTIYDANGCSRCHSVGGAGGKMGPDLSHVGAEAAHTAEWLAEHVKNPKSHNPGSRMPAYEGKIADADLKTLGDYLATLK